jgi:hypothetical protein
MSYPNGRPGPRICAEAGDSRAVGFLGRRGLAGPAAVALCADPAALVGIDRAQGRRQVHRPVVQPVRQDDQVRREPVAADVRGLPHFVRVTGREIAGERYAEPGAAAVAAAMRADQEQRPGFWRTAGQRPGR